jgi:hypothetical protein
MDCKKLSEIYNNSCFVEFTTDSESALNKISIMDLNFKKDQTCLESMKLIVKYCKEDKSSTS